MLNSFSGIGRLGSTPEIHKNSDKVFAHFNIAINEFFKQNGELQKRTHWIPCVTYGRLAEIAGEFLKRGSQIGVRGPLRLNQWTNDKGQNQQKLQVRVLELELLASKQDGESVKVRGEVEQSEEY